MKRILFLVGFLIWANYAFSQIKVALTPQTGATISNLTLSLDADGIFAPPGEVSFFSTLGASLGLGVNLQINEWFSLQPELLWIQKGFEPVNPVAGRDINNQVFFLDGTAIINYLEIPLLARVKLGGDKVYLFLQGGPSLGFGLGGIYEEAFFDRTNFGLIAFNERAILFGAEPPSNTTNVYIENRWDVGGQLGGGIGIGAGPGYIEFGIRYGFSFTDLFTPPNFPNAQNTYSNQFILVNVGYQIPLNKDNSSRSRSFQPYTNYPNSCIRPSPRPKPRKR